MALGFKNLLNSGLQFEAEEEDLAFRFGLLNSVMLVSVVSCLFFVGMELAGFNTLGTTQTFVTVLDAAVSLACLLYLRGRKAAYPAVAGLMLMASYLTFTSALVLVTQDEFRLVWYYILAVCAYLLLGLRSGIAFTLLSIVTVVLAKAFFGVSISDNALVTFVVSLSVTSGITWGYTRLAESYFKRMLENFAQLRELADRDPLTALWNARVFYATTQQLIQLAHRQQTPYATLFIDLDHFKSVNDTHGHEIGDQVLRRSAQTILAHLRSSDVVGRVGGEEFVAFLPSTDEAGALQLAEKLRAALAAQIHPLPNNQTLTVTASIGVAPSKISAPANPPTSIAEIQRRADVAMYHAKQSGRNRVALFDPQWA